MQRSNVCFDFRHVTQYGMFMSRAYSPWQCFGLGQVLAASGISISSPAGLHRGDTFRIAFMTQEGRRQLHPTSPTTMISLILMPRRRRAAGPSHTRHPVTSRQSPPLPRRMLSTISVNRSSRHLADGTQMQHQTPVHQVACGPEPTRTSRRRIYWGTSLIPLSVIAHPTPVLLPLPPGGFLLPCGVILNPTTSLFLTDGSITHKQMQAILFPCMQYQKC